MNDIWDAVFNGAYNSTEMYSPALRTYIYVNSIAEQTLAALWALERCMRFLCETHPEVPMTIEQLNAWNLGVASFIEAACLYPYASGMPRFLLGSERSVNSVAQEFKITETDTGFTVSA